MAIEKESTYDYEVIGDESTLTKGYGVQVRRTDTFTEDGVEISNAIHRHVIYPHMDWSSEPTKIKSVCDALFTAEIIKKYLADRKALDGWEPNESGLGQNEVLDEAEGD